MEVLIFCADKLTGDGHFQKFVFNFTVVLKSWKFEARKMYVFYNISSCGGAKIYYQDLIRVAVKCRLPFMDYSQL